MDPSPLSIKRTTTNINPEFLEMKRYMSAENYFFMLADEAVGSNVVSKQFFVGFCSRYLYDRRVSWQHVVKMFEQIVMRRIDQIRHSSWFEEGNAIANHDALLDEAVNAHAKK